MEKDSLQLWPALIGQEKRDRVLVDTTEGLVGCRKTVTGPSAESASTRPAALTAATSVLKSSLPTAISTMFGDWAMRLAVMTCREDAVIDSVPLQLCWQLEAAADLAVMT